GDRGLRPRRGRRGRPMKRVAVVVFPGSNCDAETLAAAQAAGSDAYFVWHRDTDLRQADVVILPGGFSYGDYLRSGAIARFSKVMGAVTEHARAGGAVLGICNGFQILCEAGLLPGGLMRNVRLRFLSRPVWVRVEQTDTPFTCLYEKGEVLEIPVAHGDGRYVVDSRTAAELEATNCVVWRYVRDNPNGSANAVAGVTTRARARAPRPPTRGAAAGGRRPAPGAAQHAAPAGAGRAAPRARRPVHLPRHRHDLPGHERAGGLLGVGAPDRRASPGRYDVPLLPERLRIHLRHGGCGVPPDRPGGGCGVALAGPWLQRAVVLALRHATARPGASGRRHAHGEITFDTLRPMPDKPSRNEEEY